MSLNTLSLLQSILGVKRSKEIAMVRRLTQVGKIAKKATTKKKTTSNKKEIDIATRKEF